MLGGLITSPEMCCEKSAERPSVAVELQRRRDKAAQELQLIDEAIALFQNKPELERALSLLGTIGVNRY